MLWTIFRRFACFVAVGFQFAHRRSPDPLATRGGIGRFGHQLTERTTKCSLKKAVGVPIPGGRDKSLLVPTSLRLPGWIKEELGRGAYCSGNNRGQTVPLRRTTNCTAGKDSGSFDVLVGV